MVEVIPKKIAKTTIKIYKKPQNPGFKTSKQPKTRHTSPINNQLPRLNCAKMSVVNS